jgi:RNA polymerase sigma factor (TIGR02999 family)
VYDELRGLARRQLARLRPGETLSPTALVHEAYVRFARRSAPSIVDESHFIALAARAMRNIVIDFIRRKRAQKRDAGPPLAAPDLDAAAAAGLGAVDLLALDEALTQLQALDPRQAQVVELRFFAGLEVEEIARATGVSERTVKRDWQRARVFLYHRLSAG